MVMLLKLWFTSKRKFVQIDATNEAFQALKDNLVQASILVLLDFAKQFIIETDALGFSGSGFTLRGHLIAYFNKKLPLHLCKMSSFVWELHAMI